jgi:hypothetical protein
MISVQRFEDLIVPRLLWFDFSAEGEEGRPLNDHAHERKATYCSPRPCTA